MLSIKSVLISLPFLSLKYFCMSIKHYVIKKFIAYVWHTNYGKTNGKVKKLKICYTISCL